MSNKKEHFRDIDELKLKRKKAKERQKLLEKVLFFVLCLISALIILTIILSYIGGGNFKIEEKEQTVSIYDSAHNTEGKCQTQTFTFCVL